jgi:hypothetical protein
MCPDSSRVITWMSACGACECARVAAILYLLQEDLAALRKRVTDAAEKHRAAMRDLTLIQERKAEMEVELRNTENLIRFGKMPPPSTQLMELAQSKALTAFDNRPAARAVLL